MLRGMSRRLTIWLALFVFIPLLITPLVQPPTASASSLPSTAGQLCAASFEQMAGQGRFGIAGADRFGIAGAGRFGIAGAGRFGIAGAGRFGIAGAGMTEVEKEKIEKEIMPNLVGPEWLLNQYPSMVDKSTGDLLIEPVALLIVDDFNFPADPKDGSIPYGRGYNGAKSHGYQVAEVVQDQIATLAQVTGLSPASIPIELVPVNIADANGYYGVNELAVLLDDALQETVARGYDRIVINMSFVFVECFDDFNNNGTYEPGEDFLFWDPNITGTNGANSFIDNYNQLRSTNYPDYSLIRHIVDGLPNNEIDGGRFIQNPDDPDAKPIQTYAQAEFYALSLMVPSDDDDSHPVDETNPLRVLLNNYMTDETLQIVPVGASGNFADWFLEYDPNDDGILEPREPVPFAPARWDEVIAVSAQQGYTGDLWSYQSPNGIWYYSQNGTVAMPGSWYYFDDNHYRSGTSFAAPFVSIHAALYLTHEFGACTFDHSTPLPPVNNPLDWNNLTFYGQDPYPINGEQGTYPTGIFTCNLANSNIFHPYEDERTSGDNANIDVTLEEGGYNPATRQVDYRITLDITEAKVNTQPEATRVKLQFRLPKDLKPVQIDYEEAPKTFYNPDTGTWWLGTVDASIPATFKLTVNTQHDVAHDDGDFVVGDVSLKAKNANADQTVCTSSGEGFECAASESGVVVTSIGQPVAPLITDVISLSDTSSEVIWNDRSSNETGFTVLGAGTGETVGPNTTTGTDTGYASTPCDRAQSYTVQAFTTGKVWDPGTWGYVAYSASNTSPAFDATIGEACPPDGSPSNLVATFNNTSGAVDLSWDDNTNNEDNFTVERREDGSSTWVVLTSTLGPDTTTYADASAACETTYDYRVKATNAGGDSSYSNIDGASTLCSPNGDPTNLSAGYDGTTGDIDLTWVDNATNEASYTVERSDDGGATWSPLANGLPVDSTSYTDNSVVCGASYSYRVKAVNASGTSAPSNVAAAEVACPLNGSFEDPLSLWMTSANVGRLQNSQAYDGNHLLLLNNPGSLDFAQQTMNNGGSTGDNVSITFYVAGRNVPTSGVIGVRIELMASGTPVDTFTCGYGGPRGSFGWQPVTCNGTATASYDSIRVSVGAKNVNGGKIGFDYFRLTQN